MDISTKTILFLGGNGFLGRNVLDYYTSSVNCYTTKFIVVSRNPLLASFEDKHKLIEVVNIDYSNREHLEFLFKKYNIIEVFHFISSSVPATSNNDIGLDIKVNLLGTIALLELMVKYKVQKLTYISSGGAIYGDSKVGGSQENDFNNPNNSYGIVKLTIEKYIALFNKLHNIQYLILRLSNPFGYFHKSQNNGLVNIAIRKAIKGEPIIVWGDGSITKDYIYAKDFARIFWLLYEKQVRNQILNIGSGNTYSILEILESIKKIIPNTKWVFEGAKSFDTQKVKFSLESLRKMILIENTPLLDAIQEVYEWEYNK
jgi:UDP-glucose 4-epimerase